MTLLKKEGGTMPTFPHFDRTIIFSQFDQQLRRP